MTNSRGSHGTLTRWTSAAAFLGPAILYLWTAGQQPFFLDSAEFVAASARAGLAHPPGTPLYTLLAHGFALLFPLGGIAFRIHLLNALLAGGLGVLLMATQRRVVGRVFLEGELVFLGLTWLYALSPALWFQSVRAEVYTLNALICLGLVYLALVWIHQPEQWGAGVLAAFLAGLGLTNHHYLVALTVSGLFLVLMLVPGIRRTMLSLRVLVLLGFGLAGLLVYVYLPVRGHQGWLLWGDPATSSGFLSIVTAQAYQSSMATPDKAPVLEAMGTVVTSWVELLGPWLWTVGMLGLVVLLVRRWQVGLVLCAAVLAGVLSKSLMFLDVTNPDDHGYFLTGMSAWVAGGAGVLLMASSSLGRERVVAGLVLVGVVVQAAMVFPGSLDRNRLDRFQGPDLLNRHFLQRVPPEGVLLPSYYPVTFNHRYYQEVEGRRPDVDTLHQSMYVNYDGGRGYARDVAARSPDLAPVMEEFLSHGGFPAAALRKVAGRRPVLLETDVWSVFRPLQAFARFSLSDGGLQLEVPDAPAPLGGAGTRLHVMELEFTGPGLLLRPFKTWGPEEPLRQVSFWRGLYRDLDGFPLHPELRKLLYWAHYRDAMYFINRGKPDEALREISMALHHHQPGSPDSLILEDLKRLLEDRSQRVEVIPPRQGECHRPGPNPSDVPIYIP